MPTSSPLAALVATLANVCYQAEQNHALLSKNEAATRAALIDPVLRALGWDTTDVTMVVPEFAIGSKQRPDYFLKHHNGTVHFVIEAKKLGEPLDKMGHTGKLIGYAFSLKPAAHFVTDGLHWHCFLPTHSQYEPAATLHITETTLLPASLQLLQLLDAAHGGYGLHMAPAAVAQPVNTAALISNHQILIPSKVSATAPAKTYQPLSIDITDPTKQLGKPHWLNLPDGKEHALKTWKDILVKSAEFVLQTQGKLTIPLSDKAGKKTLLLNWLPPKKGLSFNILTYQGKPIYLYTNYDSAGIVANALYLLQQLPKGAGNEAAIAF